MEKVKCYNCNIDDSTFYDKENGYTLVKCNSCGLIYVNPRPSETEIKDAIKLGVHKGNREIDVTGKYSPKKIRRYLEILSLIFSDLNIRNKEITWLDIGSGFGEFMESLNIFINGKLFIEGVEPNEKKRNDAIKRNLIVRDSIEDITLKKYDFISALNVYSHLPNPVNTLVGWRDLLNKGGLLLIETGNTANLKPKDHPKPYLLPDHLSFASEKIVRNILNKCGFKVLMIHFERSSVYPILNISNLVKEIYNSVRTITFKNRFKFFPKNPYIDMWILAEKIE